MKVFLNPGHAPNGDPDPGACGFGLEEALVVKEVADLVEQYITAAGVEVVGNFQCDDLYDICDEANSSGADIFVSIHCNAFNGIAEGTEVEVYDAYDDEDGSVTLANCILNQIVDSLDTVDRGVKSRPGLAVINGTDMTAVLVELAFIDQEDDAELLKNNLDDFARAVARGITDYEAQL